METEHDRLTLDGLSKCLETVNKQAESVGSLTDTIHRLADIIIAQESSRFTKPTPSDVKPPRWLYRFSHEKSRGKIDNEGNMKSGNTEWALDSETDIALHFAEFHSDQGNTKDTALLSATHDAIRAVKAAYREFENGSFQTRDRNKIFISIIHTSKYHEAKELLKMAQKPPLCYRISKESRERLCKPTHMHLHDSEVLFLHSIPKEDIVLQVSLQDLVDRDLADVLPELDGKHSFYNKHRWPKEIRRLMSESNLSTPTNRFVKFYNMVAQNDSKKVVESLMMAQKLLYDDELLPLGVKEEGCRVLQNKIDDLRRPRVRKVMRSGTPSNVDREQDESITVTSSGGTQKIAKIQAPSPVDCSSVDKGNTGPGFADD